MSGIRLQVFFSGRVQGVGFRYFVYEQAKSIGVNGWVKNLHDGRVEALLEGEEAVVKKLIEKLREGPSMSKVNHVETNSVDSEPQHNDFQVR